MSKVYTERKSPFLAGTLSVIPGLGQIYNEQTVKGILLFVLFIGTFLLFVLRFSPMYFLDQFGMEISAYRGMIRTFPTPINGSGISRFYPLLWFIVIFPFFIVYSITDAVQTARRINLGFSTGVPPQPASPPPPPGKTADTLVQQDKLRTEAQQKMGSSPASSTFQPTMEEPMNTPNNSTTSSQPQSKSCRESRGVSGKFLLGIILMAVGGTFILEDFFHIPVWSVHSWDKLWPLIPLVFGLRILREYQRDRDRGQFVMGFIFTAVGGIFLLDRWTKFEVVDFIGDYWMFILFAVGILFILLDLTERHHRQS